MARITKSRARKPLAESSVSLSWGSSFGRELYCVSVQSDSHSFTVELERPEILSLLGFVAGRETFIHGVGVGGMGWTDKRTLSEKLRAFANKIALQEESE